MKKIEKLSYSKNRAKTRDYSKTKFNPYRGSEHPSWKGGLHKDGKGYIIRTVAPSIYQKEHRFVEDVLHECKLHPRKKDPPHDEPKPIGIGKCGSKAVFHDELAERLGDTELHGEENMWIAVASEARRWMRGVLENSDRGNGILYKDEILKRIGE